MTVATAILLAALALSVVIALTGIRKVSQGQCGIVERMGRYHKTLDPGLNYMAPFLDKCKYVRNVNLIPDALSVYRIDLREQILDIPKQDVITKDNVQMQVDTLVFYQIADPVAVCYEISNPVEGIRQMARTNMRNIFGEMELDVSLSARDAINEKLRATLDEATDKWGVKIIRVEIQDISPPQELKEVLQKQMVSERERRARVTQAEAEKQSVILAAEAVSRDKVLRAEGENKAITLMAEARKREKILLAEAEATAIKLKQEATATGLDAVRGVLANPDGAKGLIALETLKAQMEIARHLSSGQNTKLFLPTEVAGLFGAVGGIREMLRLDMDPKNDKNTPQQGTGTVK